MDDHIFRHGRVSNILGDSAEIKWQYYGHQLNPHRVTEILQKGYIERCCPWDDNLGAWVERISEKSAFLREAMREGFDSISTGGGCTAFSFYLPRKRYCLVTGGDGNQPKSRRQICSFCVYDKNTGEPLFCFNAPFDFALTCKIDWIGTLRKRKLIVRK